MNTSETDSTPDEVLAATRAWIERAVIGLNLCPFARAVYVKGQIRYAVTAARTDRALLDDLERELRALADATPEAVETTLLIHPRVLQEFPDYCDFLRTADAAIKRLGLSGVLQIASFHPAYQFAGTTRYDVTNCTNRSPYPMLHLLREASMDRAMAAYPESQEIYQRNIEVMRGLGVSGWEALVHGQVLGAVR
jgi:hypothetical protein